MLDEKNNQGYSMVSSANTVEDVAYGRRFRNISGMGWLVTCLFIVGETAGGGLIAMPTAMIATGLYGGVTVIILGAIMCAYTGSQLAENWTILQQRWPEYRHHCRKPYPAMGLRSLGPKCMNAVSVCLDLTQFGTAVVFLLLASKNIENFLQAFFGIHLHFCVLILIVAFSLLPITFLKSPKDFWPAVIGAMITTTIAVILICYGAITDYPHCSKEANFPPLKLSRFFMTFGTVMFAYGGHGAFPTIQHDMRRPYHFTRSVCVAFLIIGCMYLPVSMLGYLTFGDSLHDSIIPSLQVKWIQQAVNVLITLHVILALTIVFNPINQELEELFNVPQYFGYQRVLTRSGMMVLVVFVAETVPHFGVLLDLVGGSTITLMALIFPGIFNLFLVAAQKKNGVKAGLNDEGATISDIITYTPPLKLVVNLLVLACGIIGGVAATWSALNAMAGAEFSAPCYILPFLNQPSSPISASNNLSTNAHGFTNCCGMFRNVSRYGDFSLCRLPGDVSSSFSHG
jgi:vesicular inhibitory amino acid transporter